MSYTYSISETITFTLTHAKYLAFKVATDLQRMQRFYGSPSDAWITAFEMEATELLKSGYLGTVTYGFQRSGSWVEPMLKYTARDLSGLSAYDDDPGKVRPGANIVGANFHSFLTYSAAWHLLSNFERELFERNLPFQRTSGSESGLNGHLMDDRTYSSGGRALSRASLRSY
jgi:hypothetical protein